MNMTLELKMNAMLTPLVLMIGGAGNDMPAGLAGDDILGNDQLSGGTGSDQGRSNKFAWRVAA